MIETILNNRQPRELDVIRLTGETFNDCLSCKKRKLSRNAEEVSCKANECQFEPENTIRNTFVEEEYEVL